MKFLKKVFIIIILIIIRNQIYSETFISGKIETTENWIQKFSPYIIEEMAIIEKKGFVTIHPGTEVKFKKGAKLLVNGTLYVKGDINNPVRFIPFDNESFYEGIYFYSAYKSLIEFLIMIRGAITVEATSVVLNNNCILNSTGVILKDFSETIIKNNYFMNNTYGIHIEGCNIKYNIFENSFSNNRHSIYIIKNNEKDGIIKKNNFLNNVNNITNYSFMQVNCKDNYWGTNEEKNILKTIIDKKINPKTGEVIYKPYLKEKYDINFPPASYVSLIKTYFNKKKPEEDTYRFSFGGGFSSFFPFAPEYLNNENNFGLGYFATFTFNPFGPIMLGVETNFFGMENKDRTDYQFNFNLSEFLLNIYGYFGYKKDVYFLPFVRLGNGVALVSEAYKSEYPIFDGKNTYKDNEICYSLSGGAGIEWFFLSFLSFKLEGLYHHIFYQKGNISFPDIRISANIYFNTPVFLNR